MERFSFSIDGSPYFIDTENVPPFQFGENEVLSQAATDITYSQPWYEKGHSSQPFMSGQEFQNLHSGLQECVANIIDRELGKPIQSFDLEKYHHFISRNDEHYRVVSKTRDLFPEDFNFPIRKVIRDFEEILGFGLTDINPKTGKQLHIIVRINRPGSNDFNPPHKDIYEALDSDLGYIPQFVNIWIPICGVTQNSSLPVVESSHLLPESKILRTREGGVLGKNQYRVRMLKEWDGKSNLTRAKVGYGEALFFTSHLVHGFAINNEPDTTRISLEFRLFRKG